MPSKSTSASSFPLYSEKDLNDREYALWVKPGVTVDDSMDARRFIYMTDRLMADLIEERNRMKQQEAALRYG